MTDTHSPVTKSILKAAIDVLRDGGVIACPTEAVWGLSCDPLNEAAVQRLLALKQRSVNQGLILIAASFDQVEPLIGELPADRREAVLESWPGPLTWVVPAHSSVPGWITGRYDSVALRVTDHPVAAALCRAFGDPLVSTSANRSGEPPAQTEDEVRTRFGDAIDYFVPGATGTSKSPTEMRDALTGKVLRASP